MGAQRVRVRLTTRENREWWPLLIVETDANGGSKINSESTDQRGEIGVAPADC